MFPLILATYPPSVIKRTINLEFVAIFCVGPKLNNKFTSHHHITIFPKHFLGSVGGELFEKKIGLPPPPGSLVRSRCHSCVAPIFCKVLIVPLG